MKAKVPKEKELEWLRSAVFPLESFDMNYDYEDISSLKEIIGNAKIVALGEVSHGSSEIFKMKGRIIKYLVERAGFNVFAIEASMPDAYKLNKYIIAGGRSKLKKSFIEKLLKHLIKKKEDIRTLKGAADDSIFQLIAEDLLTYEIEVIANLSYKRYFLSEEDFYPKVESLYKNKIDEINAYLHED